MPGPTTKHMADELLAALDSSGRVLDYGVSRADAHRRGVWHRGAGIFVLNERGEILLERRSRTKDLFPNYYDIPGGHVEFGVSPLDTAIRELHEELGLYVPAGRLETLCEPDEVVERIVIPEKGIINLERKSLFLVILTPAEEQDVLIIAAERARLSDRERGDLGALGEVSRIELWSWERLQQATRSGGAVPVASGTETALSHQAVRKAVETACLKLRTTRQRVFWQKYRAVFGGQDTAEPDEDQLTRMLLDAPATKANESDVAEIFERASAQLAGAYQVGLFRREAAGDLVWDAKVRDPETTYVRNILAAVARGLDASSQARLRDAEDEVVDFVTEAINYPLNDGSRFCDQLGNLIDISAARQAVLLWLRHHLDSGVSADALQHPLRWFIDRSIAAGELLLDDWRRESTAAGADRIRELLRLSLGAASIDFNSPELQHELPAEDLTPAWLARYARQRCPDRLCAELGADHFLDEFLERYVRSGERCVIAYLPGNSAQAPLSLAICSAILVANPLAQIRFVPKSGAPGNDLSVSDAAAIVSVSWREEGLDLHAAVAQRRFTLVATGPSCHGLDPARLSRETARALAGSDVIVAEGQAYAEICGWRRPAYLAFRVNGRVAEAIHGVSRQRSAGGLVRVTPGVDHFEDFTAAVTRRNIDAASGQVIPAAAQTTAEYVSAILGPNCRLVTAGLFHGDSSGCYRQVRAEAVRRGTTFAAVVTGVGSKAPDEQRVRDFYAARRYPVFAIGGGGGFSGVTLKALRMLGLPVAAGVPSTDDGGSTGDLQHALSASRGFVFGMGDMAAILQDAVENQGKQAVLAHRFDSEPADLQAAVLDRIALELTNPTYPESPIGLASDFLSFVCGQLNLARVIDASFRAGAAPVLSVKGSSLRNLNVIAAYELCGCLGDRQPSDASQALSALFILEHALGTRPQVMVLPVTHESCALYVDYEDPIPLALAEAYHVAPHALQNGGRRLVGQRYIDKLPHDSRRLTAGVSGRSRESAARPAANAEYLLRLRSASLFIMGAGSLFGSQLSQLAVPGVVDALVGRRDIRRLLVLNHVRMDETLGMGLREHVEMIERVATDAASPSTLATLSDVDGRLPISTLFTDVVVPRTVAREIEAAMMALADAQVPSTKSEDDLFMSTLRSVKRNRYIDFLLSRPAVARRLQLTAREIDVLAALYDEPSPQSARTEAGRYRGAVFATEEDIAYLVSRGIQRRSIHEIDSVGENWKLLKAEGAPSFEFFPGLVPEALVGIIRIALERGTAVVQPNQNDRP